MYVDDGYRNRKFAPRAVSEPRQIVSKFASKCASCGRAIEAGEAILWTPGQYKARVTCVVCPAPAPVAPAPVAPVAPEAEVVVDVQPMLAEAACTMTDAQIERALGAEGVDHLMVAVLLAELDARMDEEIAKTAPAPVAPVVVAPVAPVVEPAPAPAPVAPSAPSFLGQDAIGIYALPDGTVVKVQANREKTKVYAKRWVASHQDRLMEAGAHAHGEYVYEPGLVAEVARTGRKLTLEEAKAHSVRYGQCVRCGRALKDGKSVEQGMGPVCVKYFS